jgi:ABC-type Na+ efflux pump permease subunit
MKSLMSTLYMAWVIGTKDILDALKNKSLRTNILIMVGMVIFFYWFGSVRPFDQDVSVVVFDKGNTNLTLSSFTLDDGAVYTFREVFSLEEMERKMAHQDLGVVLPADFDTIQETGDDLVLQGYTFWVNRAKVPELEAKYTRDFSEILGQPVQVMIGSNIVIPQADVGGMPATIAQQLVFYIFWVALALIPYLMLEEKQTRTMDALLTSPANSGQIVLGKALAGFFYILIVGGLAIALDWRYIVNWWLALAAILGYSLFAIGLGLFLGMMVKSAVQIRIWSLILILLLVLPPLFFMEPMLKAGLRKVLVGFPTSALASLFRYGCSKGVTLSLFLPNLAIAVVSIVIVYVLVIWKVRLSDR